MTNIKTRVLLVEDEEDAREILEFYLKTVFDEVLIAKDGQDGFNIAIQNQQNNQYFDLILTDIKMPNKDGITMIDEISKLIPEQKYIIVSAYKDEEYLLKSIGLNVMGYFIKPLAVDDMMDMLKKIKEQVVSNKQNNIIQINKTYTYDLDKDILYNGNISVKLSKKELALVKVLIENINNIVTKDSLKQMIWGDIETSDATMRTIVKRVKDKIKDDDFILSRKGYGYTIEIIS